MTCSFEQKQQGADSRNETEKQPKFEEQQVAHARHIMKPFVLRRLKSEVLKDLPKKTEHVIFCPMSQSQKEKYEDLVKTFSAAAGDSNLEEVGCWYMLAFRCECLHIIKIICMERKQKVGGFA